MIAGAVYSGSQWQHYATTDADEAHAYVRRTFVDMSSTTCCPTVTSWRTR